MQRFWQKFQSMDGGHFGCALLWLYIARLHWDADRVGLMCFSFVLAALSGALAWKRRARGELAVK